MTRSIGVLGTMKEAARMTAAEPSRVGLSVIGVALGLATMVATVGLAQSAERQIQFSLTDLSATEIVIRPAAESGSEADQADPLTWDDLAALDDLDGIVSWAAFSPLARPVSFEAGPQSARTSAEIFAATHHLPTAMELTVQSGRFFDRGHVSRASRLIVLGANLARRLAIDTARGTQTVLVDGEQYVVSGILASGSAGFSGGAIIPHTAAPTASPAATPTEIRLRTEPGHAAELGRAAVATLRPEDPQSLRASVPPTPTRVQTTIAAETRSLLLALGGVALVIGGLSIANVSLVSVLERVGEIGLRRALGAGRVAVSGQFVSEAALAGFTGGVGGGLAGLVVVYATATARGWTPIINPWIPLGVPLVGLAVGALAGIYPAFRAASIEPSTAVRYNQ